MTSSYQAHGVRSDEAQDKSLAANIQQSRDE